MVELRLEALLMNDAIIKAEDIGAKVKLEHYDIAEIVIYDISYIVPFEEDGVDYTEIITPAGPVIAPYHMNEVAHMIKKACE